MNYKKLQTYAYIFAITIVVLDILVIILRPFFDFNYILWFLISIAIIFAAGSPEVRYFFRHKLEETQTDLLLQEFSKKFFMLFATKIVLDQLSYLLQNYIFYVSLLEIIVMIAMAYLIGQFAFKFGRKKIYWIFGLLGFVWPLTLGILLGYFSVLELKTERDDGLI